MTRYIAFIICIAYAVSDVSSALYVPDAQIRQMIVNAHNALRRKVATRWTDKGLAASNMRKMSWDAELADEAVTQATCDRVEDISGMSWAVGGHPSVAFFDDLEDRAHGKNVAVSQHRNILQMIEEWSAGEGHFDYEYHTCEPDYACTAFKQMILANASRVGCSLNPYCELDGESVKLLVCMYDEKFSIFFDLYIVGPPCSKCQSPTGFCEDALCVSSCHGSSSGECSCQKTCHHPGVGEGVLDAHTCMCDCTYGLGIDCQDLCENPQYYVNYDYCADINNPESCETDQTFQLEFCPANCDYGCRPAP
ncbi:cysteine-rich secretory protein 1-like [Acanthaster planci]|uniref:Cysteine-rich secretory protein 1-like n=1 Tax=Acanthaster planci TaxID=133434 RepID=A0A8B7ZCI8_ACAPL|nr:cysteine-rich secretory protein 1-like [Acanthaster planci]XP_022100907.1 cysteine-rich secretory protein 1-like [Acanthaster planci]